MHSQNRYAAYRDSVSQAMSGLSPVATKLQTPAVSAVWSPRAINRTWPDLLNRDRLHIGSENAFVRSVKGSRVSDLAVPVTRYAVSGDINIAFQTMGEGPVDIILVPGIVSHVEFLH